MGKNCEEGFEKVVKLLEKKMLADYEINQTNLCKFAENGELDKLKIICSYLDENGKNAKYNLDIAGYRPNCIWDYSDNYAIRYACRNGKIDIVKYLMENWSHLIDITAEDNYAIRNACANGHINLIVYLMENWSHLIDISAVKNYAIRWACFRGHLLLVKYLMENWSHLIDITDRYNYAIRCVCKCGKIEVIVYLMENWSHLIDITAENNDAIRSACEKDKIDVVKYLIAVCLREILDCGLDTYDINEIINLLVYNDCIYEYYLLTDESNKKKIKYDKNEEIEKQIENKNTVCEQIKYHPRLINGQMGIKCKEGFEKVVKLLEKK